MFVRGTRVRVGTAGTDGRFTTVVPLPASRYAPGPAAVRAVGEFANRSGTRTFRVLAR